MAGRPKLDNSREKQYRVRLNEEEDKMLTYSSEATGVRKSEIFRQALRDYYQKVLLRQYSDENDIEYDFDDDSRINLNRIIACPFCGAKHRVDLEDESTISTYERQMGPETLYEFDSVELTCKNCGHSFFVSGYISEYPVGAVEDENYSIKLKEDNDDE